MKMEFLMWMLCSVILMLMYRLQNSRLYSLVRRRPPGQEVRVRHDREALVLHEDDPQVGVPSLDHSEFFLPAFQHLVHGISFDSHVVEHDVHVSGQKRVVSDESVDQSTSLALLHEVLLEEENPSSPHEMLHLLASVQRRSESKESTF